MHFLRFKQVWIYSIIILSFNSHEFVDLQRERVLFFFFVTANKIKKIVGNMMTDTN